MLLAACAVGMIWLLYSIKTPPTSFTPCLVKATTGIPCPSCGTTRAVQSLVEGQWLESFRINPFGLIVFAGLLVIPFWIMVDFLVKRTTFFSCYTRFEQVLRRKYVAIPLVILVLFNWIWNIYKGV
jgi:hypothetical protein